MPTIPALSSASIHNRRQFIAGSSLAAFGVCTDAWAQDSYPNKPIRIVVPYPAGGPLDGMVRMTGERLGKRLNQNVVVDNRAGASGILGADAVAKAAPDGYTFLATVIDTQVNNVALFKQLPYDPQKDFTPITLLAYAPAILVVPSDIPANTLPELVQWARANRGKVSYGSWGAGGIGHALAEALNRQYDLQAVHVPYRGEAPLVQDLLTKTVSFGFASIANTAQHIERGSLKAIAVSGAARSQAMPKIPTLLESGAVGAIHNARVWLATFAPARTPAAIVQKLQVEIKASLEEPQMMQILKSRGFEPSGGPSSELEAQIKRDLESIPKLLRDIGVEAQ
jgi:tripartite-type tricarboxylate transporter receptor subunit TctC